MNAPAIMNGDEAQTHARGGARSLGLGIYEEQAEPTAAPDHQPWRQ
jgi:hypothetical protein